MSTCEPRKPVRRQRKPEVAKATKKLLETAAGKSRASKSGMRGEQILAAFNDVAQQRGVALLHKIPTPTRRVKRGKAWSIIFVARSTVDFGGLMLDGSGRHVAIEAKTCTSKPAFYLREVEPHQREYLDAVHAANGVAALAVIFGQEQHVCIVPWDEARVVTKLTAEDLDRYRVDATTYLSRFVGGGMTSPMSNPLLLGGLVDELFISTEIAQ